MRIVGEWFACIDGVLRPVLEGSAADIAGSDCQERFLVDTGADTTVFAAGFVQRLGLPCGLPPAGVGLAGVGGAQAYVLVRTTLTLYADDGSPARIQGEFAAFTDPAATDTSILGRDVLAHFDLIVSRRRNEVVLLATNHGYRVEPP
jgi:Aspartyl protease